MRNQIGYIVMHNWYDTDYEEEGHEIHNVLFPTEEKAQEYIDIEMAYSFNDSLNNEVDGLGFDGEENVILASDGYGNQMIFDSWYIEPIFAEE